MRVIDHFPKNYSENPNDWDKNVRKLCLALNKISGITTQTSCDGHGSNNLYVCFNCYDKNSLNLLLKLLNEPRFKSKWKIFIEKPSEYITYALISQNIGEQAYLDAIKLSEWLSQQ